MSAPDAPPPDVAALAAGPAPGGDPAVRRFDRAAALGALVAVIGGAVVVLAGAFGPWLQSGLVTRDLFQAAAAADRVGLFGNGLVAGLARWTGLLAPVTLLPVVLAIARLRRLAGAAAVLVAVVVGGGTIVVLAVDGSRHAAGVHLVATGPVIVIVGAVLLALSGVALWWAAGSAVRLGWVWRSGPAGGVE